MTFCSVRRTAYTIVPLKNDINMVLPFDIKRFGKQANEDIERC